MKAPREATSARVAVTFTLPVSGVTFDAAEAAPEVIPAPADGTPPGGGV